MLIFIYLNRYTYKFSFSGLILVSRIGDENSFWNRVKMLKYLFIEIKKVFLNLDSENVAMEVGII